MSLLIWINMGHIEFSHLTTASCTSHMMSCNSLWKYAFLSWPYKNCSYLIPGRSPYQLFQESPSLLIFHLQRSLYLFSRAFVKMVTSQIPPLTNSSLGRHYGFFWVKMHLAKSIAHSVCGALKFGNWAMPFRTGD